MNSYIIEVIISVVFCISAPLIAFTLLRRRWNISWIFFAVGAGSFIFSQVVHIPLNNVLGDLGILTKLSPDNTLVLLRSCIVLGLTAGLCEELTRWLVLFLVSKFHSSPLKSVEAIGLGLGHGGIEAIILGGIFLAGNITSALAIQMNDPSLFNINATDWAAIQAQYVPVINTFGGGILPMVERSMAMTLHVMLSIWVWRAFTRKTWGPLIGAILYHAVVDATLGFLGVNKLPYWEIEGSMALMLIPAIIITIRWLRDDASFSAIPVEHTKSNLWIVIQHEFQYMVKSHRIWIIPFVFIFLSLFSVVTAYFLPELFKSMDQLKQYASMIPTPTTADAFTQLSKNFSQFGFIIVILLGMNAVAGEKDKGTASLFLTKPISRSDFILAKSITQIILIAVSLFLAALVAYGYIVYLFDTIPFWHILVFCAYLFFWFLPLIGMVQIGSTIGNSATTAAAYALGLSVLLLILYSIPTIQGLFPGSLLGVISNYKTFTGMHILQWLNPGAMACAIVLFIISNVLSIGLLENQELA